MSGTDAEGPPDRRVLLWSDRPEVARALDRAFRRLGASPVRPAAEASDRTPAPLAVLDLDGGAPAPHEARRRLGGGTRLVALVDGHSAGRLVDALADGCSEYLFYPLNPDELRLLWGRHVEEEAAGPAVQRGAGGRFRLSIPSEVRHVRPAVERIVAACREAGGLDPRRTFRLRVALGEAVTNAILYGNREDPALRVTIEAAVEPGAIRLRVTDEGAGFDPEAVPDPRRQENLRLARGRGLFLLRSVADEVRHNERGNRVSFLVRTDGSGPR